MKTLTRTAAILLLVAVSLPMFAGKKKATIKIINNSKWAVHHLYLSSSTERSWGPDQLGENVLTKGESFTLTDIDCDEYDIKVVDEDGDECILEEVELCGDESYWKITDDLLIKCAASN